MTFQYQVTIWREFELKEDADIKRLKEEIKEGYSVAYIYDRYGTGEDEFILETEIEQELVPISSCDILNDGKTIFK